VAWPETPFCPAILQCRRAGMRDPCSHSTPPAPCRKAHHHREAHHCKHLKKKKKIWNRCLTPLFLLNFKAHHHYHLLSWSSRHPSPLLFLSPLFLLGGCPVELSFFLFSPFFGGGGEDWGWARLSALFGSYLPSLFPLFNETLSH
jgi:hypothetical protein